MMIPQYENPAQGHQSITNEAVVVKDDREERFSV
jgi:hypothetical protein